MALSNAYIRIVSPLLALFIKLHGWTLRLNISNLEKTENLLKQGAIVCMFHQRFFGGIARFSKWKLAYMISTSHDGELIAKVVKYLNGIPVRGDSRKSPLRASKELMKLLNQGQSVGHMVDGPLGPCYYLKPGILKIAAKTGKPIIPMNISANRKWIFKSWDRFQVPKFFAKVKVDILDPVHIPKDIGEEELEDFRQQMEQSLIDKMNESDEDLVTGRVF